MQQVPRLSSTSTSTSTQVSSTSTSTSTWLFAITYKLLEQRWRKNVLSYKLTNQKENCCHEHKSVTKCCCTTLSDQSELSVLHLRKMTCDTTLSLRRALCGRVISPPWLKTLSTAALEAGTRKARSAGRWSLSSEVLLSCQNAKQSVSISSMSIDIFESAAECCQMLDVTTTGGCSWQRALNFFLVLLDKKNWNLTCVVQHSCWNIKTFI